MRRITGWIAFALLGVLTSSVHGQSRLAWRLEEGEKFYVESILISKDALKGTGAELKQDSERTSLASFTVKKKAADGSLVLEQRIESVKVSVQGTLPKPDASLHKLLEGATFRLTFGPKMELRVFEGYDALALRIAATDAELGKLFRSIMPEATMRRAIEEAFGFLPGAEMRPNQRWTRKVILSLGPLGSLSGLNTYTYRGYIDNKEKIDVEGTLSYVPPTHPTDFVFQKGDLKAENVRGTVLFDPQTGKPSQTEIRMHIKGSLVVQAQGQLRAIDVDQEQTIRTKFMDKPPAK
jgi:hypothetical protein